MYRLKWATSLFQSHTLYMYNGFLTSICALVCIQECCIGGADDRLSEVKVGLLFGYWGEHVVPE